MIILHVEPYKQMSVLETLLIANEIDYKVHMSVGEEHPLALPYLEVNGVPLDIIRAIDWIGDMKK